MMNETETNMELDTQTKTMDNEVNTENKTNVSDEKLPTEEIVDNLEEELSTSDNNSSLDEQGQDKIVSEEEIEEIQTTAQEEAETPETIIQNLAAQVANLQTQLEAQQEQNQSIQSQYMRLNADFENFRRRTNREKEDLEYIAKKKTINELLSVVDNFERARSQIKPGNDGELAIHKSYQGVYKTFVDSLKKIGVSAMRPEGKPFDPNYHEAMLREPTNEYPEGTVIEQLVRGYLLNEQVLRHAMVKVATAAEDELTDNSSEEISSESELN